MSTKPFRKVTQTCLTKGKKQEVLIEIPIQDSRFDRKLSICRLTQLHLFQKEVNSLFNRAIDKNIFFSTHFLASAMLPLESYRTYVAVLSNKNIGQNHLRLMIPFSLEKSAFSSCLPIIKGLSNPSAPLGTPIFDSEEAISTIGDLLHTLMDPSINLPSILVIPNLRLNSNLTRLIKAVSISYGLPIAVTSNHSRPILNSNFTLQNYFKQSIPSRILEETHYQWQRLSETAGTISYEIARQPHVINHYLEEFLELEASNNKRNDFPVLPMNRSPNLIRQTVKNLSTIDAVRIHTLNVNSKSIASLIIFVMGTETYAGKSTYNETYARFSPLKLLIERLTSCHLDDPHIRNSDSCAIASDPTIKDLWTEQEPMGSLVIGLKRNHNREVRKVASQINLYEQTKDISYKLRKKVLLSNQKMKRNFSKNCADFIS